MFSFFSFGIVGAEEGGLAGGRLVLKPALLSAAAFSSGSPHT
jgi:hypothetical protein